MKSKRRHNLFISFEHACMAMLQVMEAKPASERELSEEQLDKIRGMIEYYRHSCDEVKRELDETASNDFFAGLPDEWLDFVETQLKLESESGLPQNHTEQ